MGGESSADKKDHSVDSQGLKDVIDQELLEMKIAVLSMGPSDLESDVRIKRIFFHHEIDQARKLEVGDSCK